MKKVRLVVEAEYTGLRAIEWAIEQMDSRIQLTQAIRSSLIYFALVLSGEEEEMAKQTAEQTIKFKLFIFHLSNQSKFSFRLMI